MSPLAVALKTVREEVQAGETLADAIAFAVEETGINPTLLARKVEENWGSDPARIKNSNAGIAPAASLPEKVAPTPSEKSSGPFDFDASIIELASILGPDDGLTDIIRRYAPRLEAASRYPTLFITVSRAIPGTSVEAFDAQIRKLPAKALREVEEQLSKLPEYERDTLARSLLRAA